MFKLKGIKKLIVKYLFSTWKSVIVFRRLEMNGDTATNNNPEVLNSFPSCNAFKSTRSLSNTIEKTIWTSFLINHSIINFRTLGFYNLPYKQLKYNLLDLLVTQSKSKTTHLNMAAVAFLLPIHTL